MRGSQLTIEDKGFLPKEEGDTHLPSPELACVDVTEIDDYYNTLLKRSCPGKYMTIEEYFDNFPFQSSPSEIQIDIQEYFSDILPIIEKDNQKYLRNPPSLNIWDGIGIGRNEVRHSAFLAWLLNPVANHRQGPALLLCLLDALALHDLKKSAENGYFDVIAEDNYKELGRVDITIIGKEFFLIVEIKVDAIDQPEQINRYRKIIEIKQQSLGVKQDHCKVIYLTRDGRDSKSGVVDIALSWRQIANVFFSFSIACPNDFIKLLTEQYARFIKSTLCK